MSSANACVAGVTTSQGVALYSNNGIQKFYRGNIRNVEDTRELDLDDALTKIADVEATKAKDFLTRLKKTHKLILHLAEGLGPTARVHFTALHLADDSWALAPSLVAIHANGLEAGDFAVLARPWRRDRLVAAEQPAALRRDDEHRGGARQRRAGRPRLGLVAERQPQPPGRAQGRPDRQRRPVAQPVQGPRHRRDGDPQPRDDAGLGGRDRLAGRRPLRRPARRSPAPTATRTTTC